MKLALEKDVLGIYVSDHPLAPYEYALSKARDYTLDAIESAQDVEDYETGGTTTRYLIPDGKTIWIAGMVSSLQRKSTKKGDPMAVITVEDMEGEVPVVVFPKLYKKSGAALMPAVNEQTGETAGEAFVRINGKLERGDRGVQIIASEIEALQLDEKSNQPKSLEILLPSSSFSRQLMERIKAIICKYAGFDRVEIRMEMTSGETMCMELPCRVDAGNFVLRAELDDLLRGVGKTMVA